MALFIEPGVFSSSLFAGVGSSAQAAGPAAVDTGAAATAAPAMDTFERGPSRSSLSARPASSRTTLWGTVATASTQAACSPLESISWPLQLGITVFLVGFTCMNLAALAHRGRMEDTPVFLFWDAWNFQRGLKGEVAKERLLTIAQALEKNPGFRSGIFHRFIRNHWEAVAALDFSLGETLTLMKRGGINNETRFLLADAAIQNGKVNTAEDFLHLLDCFWYATITRKGVLNFVNRHRDFFLSLNPTDAERAKLGDCTPPITPFIKHFFTHLLPR